MNHTFGVIAERRHQAFDKVLGSPLCPGWDGRHPIAALMYALVEIQAMRGLDTTAVELSRSAEFLALKLGWDFRGILLLLRDRAVWCPFGQWQPRPGLTWEELRDAATALSKLEQVHAG